MKEQFGKLNPSERRFVVVVGLVLFIVVNLIWVRPHFYDWSELKRRLGNAEGKLDLFQKAVTQKPHYQKEVERMEKEGGAVVPQEDQATDLIRTITKQGQQSGVQIGTFFQASTRSDQFFVEKLQPVSLTADEKQLVDFLFTLGAGDSLIRVRGLTIRPDPGRQKLVVNVTLVASYQKKQTGPAPGTKAKRTRPARS